MSDLIDRQAAIDALNNIEIPRNASWYQYYQQALTAVDKLPPAQPEPKRGKWVLICDNNGMHFICDKCGAWRYHQKQKFCGECGAEMEVTE